MEERFFVSDSSPLIQYGVGQTSGWTAGYSRQADGFDQTLHFTPQRDTVALTATGVCTMSCRRAVLIPATSLTLLVPSFTNYTATVSVNTSSPFPACEIPSTTGDTPFSLYNLPPGAHHVEWDSGEVPAGEQVIFWGFEGNRPASQSGMSNLTIDDSYRSGGGVELVWHGDWATTAGTDANEGDFNPTLSWTTKQGA
jgi:hypothetical protein